MIKIASAAVGCLKIVDKDDTVYVSMIASPTKVAPIEQLSIPRLQLCAAALLTELIEDVAVSWLQSQKIGEKFLWSIK